MVMAAAAPSDLSTRLHADVLLEATLSKDSVKSSLCADEDEDSFEDCEEVSDDVSEPEDDEAGKVDWTRFQGSVRQGGGEQEAGSQDSSSSPRANCWMRPEGTAFMVQGKGGATAEAGEPLCQLAAVDWLLSEQPIEGVAQMKSSVVQKVREEHGADAPFFIAVNLQVPSSATEHRSLVFYFAIPTTSSAFQLGSLLHRFAVTEEDDAFRRDRLALIPAFPQGSWLLASVVGAQQTVRLAEVLETRFVRGEGFLEVDVNMGASSVVRGIVSMVIPCLSMLTVDMAFLVKGEDEEDLPEEVFGAVRCCSLEYGSAVPLGETA